MRSDVYFVGRNAYRYISLFMPRSVFFRWRRYLGGRVWGGLPPLRAGALFMGTHCTLNNIDHINNINDINIDDIFNSNNNIHDIHDINDISIIAAAVWIENPNMWLLNVFTLYRGQ